ncbi:MAG: hypothetical protein ACJAT4_001415 [Granulosicoccus sp.]|jgi:hypothetical protein
MPFFGFAWAVPIKNYFEGRLSLEKCEALPQERIAPALWFFFNGLLEGRGEREIFKVL